MHSLVALLFVLVAGPLSAADANFHLYLLIGQSNMAGRGTDIILGGNPTFQTKQCLIDILINKKSFDDQDEHFKNLIEITIKDYENENITFLQRDVEN